MIPRIGTDENLQISADKKICAHLRNGGAKMKWYIIPGLLIALFIYGCSSSSSGGSEAPAGDYSGVYMAASGDWGGTSYGEVTIFQNGSNAAVVFKYLSEYDISEGTITETFYEDETGVGKVHGRKMDVYWNSGAFSRFEFSEDGQSFSSSGDISFAGVKK